MARGRPRKDGTGNKPKEKVVGPEVLVEGAEAGQKRVKRKAATAAIKKVMDKYKLTPSSKAAVPAPDMEAEDGANNPTEDTATSSSATCTLLFTSLGLNNDSSSDKPSSHDTNVVNNDANEDMETNVESMKDNNPCESITKESATSQSPTDPGGPGPAPAESPSKTWTSAIWGAAAATPRSESPQPASSAPVASSPENLRAKSSGSVSKSSSKRNKSKIDKQSASSGSTPSNSSSGTPRSETPDLSSKNKKSSTKKGKSGKVRRRIRTLSDMDSEDSELSTDSPLKPKTYSDNPAEQESTAPTLRSTRIPKKNKNDVKSEAMKPDVENHTSPDEELPLIPKGFLQQQKKEQELKDKLDGATNKKVSHGSDVKLQMSEEDKLEVDKRIQSFKQIKDNQYLCKRVVNKQSKNMQCDCTLSKEEAQQGEKGCGDECINKLLFIECGKHCVLENNCCNKRFQNNQHADVEVFKTDWKGVGLRARSFIPKDTFIMEYVGEVLDSRLFRKRAKQYAKDNVQHFYFMALSKDQFVDATCKGNISRFINHSCDPNSETQKWTVNGELRVGFFTKRSIKPGEEVSFDYKFERYGNVAQKCFCGSSQCRGWLGGEPGGDSGIEEVEEWSDDDDDEEEMETHETVKKEKKKKEKKKKPKKPKKMEVDDCEEEIEKLMVTGIRNRNHTLQLCRLMLRATTTRLRLRMADMLFEADQPCLRLFLDYQGLRILYSWMFELEWSVEDLELKLRIESVLSILPMPHKTILVDSKILQTVEKWRDSSGQGVEAGSGEASRATTPTAGSSRVASPDKEDQAGDTEAMEAEPSSEAATPPPEDLCPPGEEPPDVTMPGCVDTRVDEVREVLAAQAGVADQRQDTAELEDVSMEECRVEPVPREQRPLTEEEERLRAGAGAEEEEASLEQQMVRDIQARARDLLEAWAGLQEMFRIPKKERQAARREHERDADRDHRDDAGHHQEREPGRRLSTSGPAPGPAQRQYPSYKSYHEGGRDAGLVRGGFVRPGSRRNLRLDDRTGRLCKANLYKNDKRMLFQAKVEEERRQKVARDAIFARHDQCCRLLGLSPAHTPMLPRYPEFYLLSGKWVPMPPPPHPIDPSWTAPGMAALPPQAFKPGDPPLPNPRSIYPPGCCPEPEPEPETSLDQSETEADICSFYDKLYYGEGRSQSHSSTPSPAHRSPLSEAISAQLHQNSLDYSGSQELSPDYRSPSPVVRSPPTSLQFLSSAPAPGQDAVLQSHAAELSAAHEEQVLQHEAAQPEALPASALNAEPPSQNIPRDGGDSGGLVVRIPPKWRTARDGSGRVYYYHAVTKQTQWEIPAGAWREDMGEDAGGVATTREESHRMETNDTDSDEDRGEDGDDTDTEEESEEENEENGVPEQEPEVSEIPDSDLSASEKRMLLRMRRRTKEERRNMRRIKREKFKERHEQERLVTRERHKRHRSDGLVVEHLVPARISDKDKVDLMTFKEMRERLLNKDKIREQQLKEEREEEEKERREERARVEKIRREEKRAAEKAKRESDFRQLTGEDTLDASITSTPDKDVSIPETPSTIISTPQSSVTSSAKTTQAAADTSSDMGKRKHKDKFLKEMSKVVVKILDPYRKKGVKGHIGNTDDFKHLAKKLTFTIMQKELKACKSTEELKANDKVRKKASDYVSKYMKKYDREYRRSPDQADD